MMRVEGKSRALTELRVEEFEAAGKTYYVNDTKMPGLSVRVTTNGVKAFIFTKFKHGRLIRITLGRVSALRLDAARSAVQKLHGDMAMGVDVWAARKSMANGRGETMQEAYQRFIGLKMRRPNSISSYEHLWRLHVSAGLKNKPVKEVSVGICEGSFVTLMIKNAAPTRLLHSLKR
jgi:hypothetical protein